MSIENMDWDHISWLIDQDCTTTPIKTMEFKRFNRKKGVEEHFMITLEERAVEKEEQP